jgi:hypothetical protein
MKRFLILTCFLSLLSVVTQAVPPFSGTIFLDPDIILPSDPTTFLDLEDAGTGSRLMFDRRSGWVTVEAFLFNASYLAGGSIEIQVNPEFESTEAARQEALRFASVIGQLPRALLRDVQTVWIHKGENPFGGGNNNLLIHTGMAASYIADGILEETLVHEACHTSLDADHAASSGWLAAQTNDPDFISTYARDNATREDIAETFLLWLAARYRTDRIAESLLTTIEATVPNRLTYFDQQNFDLLPIVIPEQPPVLRMFSFGRDTKAFQLSWNSRIGGVYLIERSTNLVDWEDLENDLQSQGETTDYSGSVEFSGQPFFLRVCESIE